MDKVELIEKLRTLDEVVLIELLGVTSTEIVDAFQTLFMSVTTIFMSKSEESLLRRKKRQMIPSYQRTTQKY